MDEKTANIQLKRLETPKKQHVAVVRIECVVPAMGEPHPLTGLTHNSIKVVLPICGVALDRVKGHTITVKHHARVTMHRVARVLPDGNGASQGLYLHAL